MPDQGEAEGLSLQTAGLAGDLHSLLLGACPHCPCEPSPFVAGNRFPGSPGLQRRRTTMTPRAAQFVGLESGGLHVIASPLAWEPVAYSSSTDFADYTDLKTSWNNSGQSALVPF